MKKIDKEFTLSDSSVNCYGFRLLTSGYQLSEFAKNPIGYYMHDRDSGVLVRWDELQIKGDDIIGKPVINTANVRGQQTVDEVESGFLSAASVGHIVALETSEDPTLKLPGQIGPTVTKWFNRECSLVDIPGNFNSYCLYDLKGNILQNLKASSLNIESNTANNFLSTALSMSWSQLDKSGLLPRLKDENFTLFKLKYRSAFGNDWKKSKPLKTAVNAVNSLEKQSLVAINEKVDVDVDVNRLLASAIKDNDITEEVAQELKKQYENKPDDLPGILESFADVRLKFLMALDWNELDKSDKLSQELQEKFLTAYKIKRFLQFGKKTNGAIDSEAFLKFALDNGYIAKDFPTWNLEEGGTNTQDVVFDRIYNLIIRSTKSLIVPLDQLSEDQIERLKQEAFADYKRMYFKTFGIQCKEPFKIGKLNK